MKIKSLKTELSDLIYIFIFFSFTAGAFYGISKYPPFLDYDSATMSIFINNISYNDSYNFGFKGSDNFYDIYRQYWAAHFLPTSVILSIIQKLFLIPPSSTDIFLKIISLLIGISGCFSAALLLPKESKADRFFLMFTTLYAPISFLYFRTAVVNIMISFTLFWMAVYVFYLFVCSQKNVYLYVLAVILAYYGKNPYLHIIFLPLIFSGYILYKKLFMKLLRNRHVYLSAVLMIVLYSGSAFILSLRYDDSYASFTEKTEQFLKLRGGSLSLNNLAPNLFKDKALKYVNQHVHPRHDSLGDRSRSDLIWTFNDICGLWKVFYILFITGIFITFFARKIDDISMLFLIITISIFLICFTFSFPEGRYMLPLVPCYSFFVIKSLNFIWNSVYNRFIIKPVICRLYPLIYLLIILFLSLNTFSLLTGKHNSFLLKEYHDLYGLKQGIGYIIENDQARDPMLYRRAFNLGALLCNRLYSNFQIRLIGYNRLHDILSRIDRSDTNTYPNVYFIEEGENLTNLTYEGFPLKLLAEYKDEYANEPICLLKLIVE